MKRTPEKNDHKVKTAVRAILPPPVEENSRAWWHLYQVHLGCLACDMASHVEVSSMPSRSEYAIGGVC